MHCLFKLNRTLLGINLSKAVISFLPNLDKSGSERFLLVISFVSASAINIYFTPFFFKLVEDYKKEVEAQQVFK